MASGRYQREQVARPHFETTVEDFLDAKRRKGLSKWMEPAKTVHPKPQPPRSGDDAEVRAHWKYLVENGLTKRRRK